jgi:multiple sugar transport system substrate-binding protein
MNHRFSRRQLVVSGIGTAATLSGLSLLSACGTSTIPTGSIDVNATLGPAQLELYFWGAAARDTITRKVIDLYTKAHSGITFNSSFTGFSTYWTKLDTQIAGGGEPDVFTMDMRYVKKYADKKLIVNLKDYFSNDKPIDLRDYDQQLLNSARVDGELYGIPTGGNYTAYVYSKTLVERANIGPVPQTFTWDTFAEYTAKLHESLKTVYGAQDMSHILTAFEVWVRQHNAELYTKDGSKLGFDRSVVLGWFKFWDKMRKSGGCVPAEIEKAYDGTNGAPTSTLINGKSVFVHIPSNLFEQYAQATKDSLGLISIPKSTESKATPGMFQKPSMLWSIGTRSKYKLHAASFIGFCTNNDEAIKTLQIDRGVPGSTHAQQVLKPTLTPFQQITVSYHQVVASLNKDLVRAKTILDSAGAGTVDTALGNAAYAVAYGNKSPEAAADSFMKEAAAGLEQAIEG